MSMPFVLLALMMLGSLFGQAADGLSVTTDMAAYSQGQPVQVTVQNGGPDAVTRGGLVCDDVWPLAVEQLAADASWQAVVVPRRDTCIGVAAVVFRPGQSLMRTLSLSLDAGTYRVAYAFNVVSSASSPNLLVAYSDAFDVLPPADPSA